MMQDYHRTVLDNGLRIVTAPRYNAQSAAIGVWINAGGRHENRRINGVSHFLEHLLFKGTASRSARAIKESIEGRGGVLNAFTDEEFTCVLAKVQPKDVRGTLDVLTDMVLHPALDSKEISRERQVVLEEIRMYKDLPMQYVHDLLNTLLWPNHPLGMLLAGTEKSVGRIGRKEILSYQKRSYTPANVVIATCGRVSHREVVEAVTRLWKQVPSGRRHVASRVRQGQKRPHLKVEKKETEQTHFSLGFHAFPRNHPQVHALNLLNVILGGNMSSRLFQKIREEQGLAYEIGSQVKRYRDTGFFSISAGVEHKHMLRCMRVILKELARIRRELVTPKEFEQAREYLMGQVLFSLEDTVDHMCWVGECEMLLNRVDPAEAVLRHIARVRRQDLREVAKAVVRQERINLAAIGPMGEKVSHRMSQLLEMRP